MARRERGVIRMIFNDFISFITPQFRKRKLVGEDFYGTKYYETPPKKGSAKRNARHFEPINKEDFTQELPAEWEAWLRYRRINPPTKEEIEENYKIILMKRKNAVELEQIYEKKAIKHPSLQTGAQVPGGFPVYEEYNQLGTQYIPQKKKSF